MCAALCLLWTPFDFEAECVKPRGADFTDKASECGIECIPATRVFRRHGLWTSISGPPSNPKRKFLEIRVNKTVAVYRASTTNYKNVLLRCLQQMSDQEKYSQM